MSESTNSSPKKTFIVPTNRQKNIAAICYIFFLIGYFTVEKDSAFVKFHIKQSLTLLIFGILTNILLIIPILGWIIYPFATIAVIVLFIIGILNALGGKEKELPFIGKYAENFNL
jgi:uncharacterized membrane protein